MRSIDRLLGRGTTSTAPFGTRAFGTSQAEAAAIAAAAGRAGGSGDVAGTSGRAGTGSNMTTSTYSGTTSARPAGPPAGAIR